MTFIGFQRIHQNLEYQIEFPYHVSCLQCPCHKKQPHVLNRQHLQILHLQKILRLGQLLILRLQKIMQVLNDIY